jgi:hypothetical protein
MLGNSLMVYLIPFILANSTTNYVLSKKNEKKLIAQFSDIQANKIPRSNGKFLVPDELKKLVKIIEDKIDKCNLNNLYNNLNSVIIKKNFLLLLIGVKGKYNSKDNILSYSLDGTIEHEFIHLASSQYDEENNIWKIGFVDYSQKIVSMKALNEGYTDLLTRRFFNKKTTFYSDEVRIVEFIELLFNKKELEKYYFNNDLPGFIKHLSNYMDKENVIKFLLDFDRGFDLKKQGNPAYKILYTNLELKLCALFEKHNKSLKKQFDYLNLLDRATLTNVTHKVKAKIVNNKTIL